MAALRGAFRLAQARPEGLLLIEDTPAGAARSFWAAALCLPVFLALRLIAWSDGRPPPVGLSTALVVELLGYVCGWVGFALASRPLARAAGRAAHWPHFLAAWNWANVVQYVALLVLLLPAAFGAPRLLAEGLGLAAMGYAVWLEWFVTRTALRLSGGAAAGFVAVDLALGVLIGSVVARLNGL